ncbi:MAG: esterase-like activity of phytase family protein [Burkholderiaceae bacterium]
MQLNTSFIKPPADAPPNLAISGRFRHSDGRRRDVLGSIPGIAALSDPKAPRPTGMDAPFQGQPIQGFSGIRWRPDGTAWVVSDGGFGSKANSPDVMTMIHHVRPVWATGQLEVLRTVFLHDPDGVVPFNVENAATLKRYLTGADFDFESIQVIGESIWLGDEYGPYLVRTDFSGKVTGFFETLVDGVVLRSPDHFRVYTPPRPGPFATTVQRSRGFEGLGASPDGRYLYPMFEGPLWLPPTQAWKQRHVEEKTLRILEFDVQQGAYTGKHFRYALETAGNHVGAFKLIDSATGLVIERDNREGDLTQACQGPPRPDCYNRPALFKRIYKIDLSKPDAKGFVRKIGYIDLLDIADPKAVARIGARNGKFSFPLWTIEGLDVVDADHIVVLNDNNLTWSAGREFGQPEANEMILLRVPELLRAR